MRCDTYGTSPYRVYVKFSQPDHDMYILLAKKAACSSSPGMIGWHSITSITCSSFMLGPRTLKPTQRRSRFNILPNNARENTINLMANSHPPMAPSNSPPLSPPNFSNITPDAILAETEAILTTTSTLHDHLATTLTPTTAIFQNLVAPIIDDANRASCRLFILSELLSQLSPDLEVRRAAQQSQRLIAAAQVELLMRQDVAVLVFAVYARETSSPSADLDEEDRYLLSFLRGKYVRSGACLHDGTERELFRVASDELSEICSAAQSTFIEPEEGIWLERAELSGIPEALLATMIEDGGHVQVSFRKDHVDAMLNHASSSDTRRRFTVASWQRLPENVRRLEKAVALRDEIARVLGFENHAALKMESRMAPSVAEVEAQLEELHERLKSVARAGTDRLLELKRADPATGEEDMSELYAWDKAYYGQKQKQNTSQVDHSLLSEYFEARHTLKAMLTLFHDLFGMDFQPTVMSVWHESVTSYQVWDSPSEGGQFLGYLDVDLFEREGKYRGAHCISIQPVSLRRQLISPTSSR